jgi:BirA family biotin operon repressor/biotin-[acetyl-CoA-carboxylase] ligase
LFNIEEFDIKLDTEIIGRNFIYFDEVDSTNSYLLNSKESKLGTVVLSEYQSKGRGRKQRNWIAVKDQALTFSILLNSEIELKNINVLSLGSAVALVQALENLHQLKVNVKWPNDVLVEDKKIAGILIESSSKGSKLDKIVVGIGINVNQPNFTGVYNIRPTSIRIEHKKPVSREKILSEFLNRFEEMLIDLGNNKEKILNDWRSRSRLLGEKVLITENDIEKFGLFEDIDDNGFLLLRTKDGLETIQVGDVSIKM